jgi:ribosomal protein S18 acetylase RimI-like enzyme
MAPRLIAALDNTFSKNEELRERADSPTAAACTSRFCLEVGDDEVGYVAIDFQHDQCVLYELWICSERRKQGHGTTALRLAESEARARGYREFLVRPTQT